MTAVSAAREAVLAAKAAPAAGKKEKKRKAAKVKAAETAVHAAAATQNAAHEAASKSRAAFQAAEVELCRLTVSKPDGGLPRAQVCASLYTWKRLSGSLSLLIIQHPYESAHGHSA